MRPTPLRITAEELDVWMIPAVVVTERCRAARPPISPDLRFEVATKSLQGAAGQSTDKPLNGSTSEGYLIEGFNLVRPESPA